MTSPEQDACEFDAERQQDWDEQAGDVWANREAEEANSERCENLDADMQAEIAYEKFLANPEIAPTTDAF